MATGFSLRSDVLRYLKSKHPQYYARMQYEKEDSGEPEQHKGPQWINLGGARAMVDDDGKILKGCEGLKGFDIDSLDETADERADKQEQAEAEGWESQKTKDLRKTWEQAKKQAPEALVVVRSGSKFYSFLADAAALRELSDTGDGETAEFDADKLDHHLGRMIEAGHHVAVVDRSEDGSPDFESEADPDAKEIVGETRQEMVEEAAEEAPEPETRPDELAAFAQKVAGAIKNGDPVPDGTDELMAAMAKEAIRNGESISKTMRRHGVDPHLWGFRGALADEVDRQRELAKPKPSPARQKAMDRQAQPPQTPAAPVTPPQPPAQAPVAAPQPSATDRHSATGAQIANAPNTLQRLLNGMHTLRDTRKTGSAVSKDIGADYAKGMYEYLRDIEKKGDGFGDVYDLSKELGHGALGYASPAGNLVFIPPMMKSDDWEVRYSLANPEVQPHPAEAAPAQAPQAAEPEPVQPEVAPEPVAPPRKPKPQAGDRAFNSRQYKEAMTEAIGDDPEMQNRFTEIARQTFKDQSRYNREYNDSLREMFAEVGVNPGAFVKTVKDFASKGGDYAGFQKKYRDGLGKKFDQMAHFAASYRPELLTGVTTESTGEMNNEDMLWNTLTQPESLYRNENVRPYDPEIIDLAKEQFNSEMSSYDEHERRLREDPEYAAWSAEMAAATFSRSGVKDRVLKWATSSLSRWRKYRKVCRDYAKQLSFSFDEDVHPRATEQVTVGGTTYTPGEFIPKEKAAEATPEEKEKIADAPPSSEEDAAASPRQDDIESQVAGKIGQRAMDALKQAMPDLKFAPYDRQSKKPPFYDSSTGTIYGAETGTRTAKHEIGHALTMSGRSMIQPDSWHSAVDDVEAGADLAAYSGAKMERVPKDMGWNNDPQNPRNYNWSELQAHMVGDYLDGSLPDSLKKVVETVAKGWPEMRLGKFIEAFNAEQPSAPTASPKPLPEAPAGDLRNEELAIKAKAGDQGAAAELVTKNRKFIVSFAKRYARNEDELEDLVQEGNIAILKAIDSFAPEKGFAFTTHVGWAIKGAVSSAAKKMHKGGKQQLTDQEDQSSAIDQFAEKKEQATRFSAEAMDRLEKEVHLLPEEQRKVISMKFGFGRKHPMDYREIGEALGISKSQAHKLASQGMQDLAHVMHRVMNYARVRALVKRYYKEKKPDKYAALRDAVLQYVRQNFPQRYARNPGESKTVNGVQYVLNQNHRWERAKDAQAAPAQPAAPVEPPSQKKRSAAEQVPQVSVTYRNTEFTTGKPVTFEFIRGTEKSKNFGSTYQQDIEPAGRYMIQKEVDQVLPGWESGSISFNKPLVVPFNTTPFNGYDETSWKAQLSKAYGGLTGKKLSQALARDGYDGIVTVSLGTGGKPYDTREIIDLTSFHPKRETPATPSSKPPQTDTPEFRNWFGRSAVVNADGSPMRLYHGTNADFEAFDPKKSFGKLGATFFSSDPEFASGHDYAGTRSGANVKPVYVRSVNPFNPNDPAHLDALKKTMTGQIWTASGFKPASSLVDRIRGSDYFSLEDPTLFNAIKKAGFDSVMVTENGSSNIAVFDPRNVKSATGNRGSFDPKDKRINYARLREAVQQYVKEHYARVKSSPGQRSLFTEDDHPRAKEAVTIGSTSYVPGEFIPKDKAAEASPDEAEKIEGMPEGANAEPEAPASKTRPVAEWTPEERIADWQKNNIRGESFKAFFGPWDSNPAEASKVVDSKTGEPQETSNIPGTGSMVKDAEGHPVAVYHGTSHGGFEAFDKEKISDNNLFGPGFYFTESRDVAKEYTSKDAVDAFAVAASVASQIEKSIEDFLPDGWKVLQHSANSPNRPNQVELQSPSGDTFKLFEREGKSAFAFHDDMFHAIPERLLHLDDSQKSAWVKMLNDAGVKEETREIKSVYLNIRKPFDIDRDKISFDHLSSNARKKVAEYRKSITEPKRRSQIETGEKADMHRRETVAFLDLLKTMKADVNWLKDPKQVERDLATGNPEAVQKWEAMTDRQHDAFQWYKDSIRKAGVFQEMSNGYAREIADINNDKGVSYHDLEAAFGGSRSTVNKVIQKAGHDGLTHTGGHIMGNVEHRVWIAFEPNQIKATDNQGTFDPNDDRLKYSQTGE